MQNQGFLSGSRDFPPCKVLYKLSKITLDICGRRRSLWNARKVARSSSETVCTLAIHPHYPNHTSHLIAALNGHSSLLCSQVVGNRCFFETLQSQSVVAVVLFGHESELVLETRTRPPRLCINHFFRAYHGLHFLNLTRHCHHSQNHMASDDVCCRCDKDRPSSAGSIPPTVEHELSLPNVLHQPLLVCVWVMYYSGQPPARFVVHLRLPALGFELQSFLQSMTSKLGSLESGSKIDAVLRPTSQPKSLLL